MNVKCLVKHVFVILLDFSTTLVRADSDLVKDMVHFDQVYVPALALSSLDNVKAARIAMTSFEPVWKSFKGKYYLKSSGDS